MFKGCSSLIYLDLNNFTTSNVKYMNYMFSSCTSLENINITLFNTSSVIDMNHMFENCISLLSIDLSSFDTRETHNIDYMFSNDTNLSFVNFSNLQDNNIDSMLNIFKGTLSNMVFCFNKNSAPKFNKQIENKGCSIIDCDENWWKNRKLIIATNNVCIEQCNDHYNFLFDYKCFFRCPPGSYSENYVCTKKEDKKVENITCDIKNFYMLGCDLDINNETAKQKLIEKTVTGFMNMELYDLALMVIDHHEIYTRSTEKETFQIYALSNKKRKENLTYINLDDCGDILKQKHNIPNDELIVFKIEYYSPNFMIPIIEYNIFGKGGRLKLNLNYCKSSKVNYYIPININNFQEYLYNPTNVYYLDKCYPTPPELQTDLILYDRKDDYNKQNRSLCESICTFKGYINNKVECECEIKLKFNSFLNVNANKYKLIDRFTDNELTNSFNIWVMKCFLKYLTIMETLTSNIINYIILIVLLINIICALIFYFKEKYTFFGKLEKLNNGIDLKNKFEGNTKSSKKNNNDDEESQNESGQPFNKSIYEPKKLNLNKHIKKSKISLKTDKSTKNRFNDNNMKTNGGAVSNKIKIKKITKLKVEILEKTENELNFASYNDAKLNDRRGFCKYYISLMKTKHLLVFPFTKKNDFNSRSMKISFLFLIIGINLTIVMFFIDESSFHELYKSQGVFNLAFHFPKIMYATIISLFLKDLLISTIFTENNFLQKKYKLLSGVYDKRNRDMAKISLKIACFFPISIIFLFLFFYYIMCFGSVFRNSQIFILEMSLISFIIQLTFPFVFNTITCCIRVYSLKKSKNREYLYRLSQVLQSI